MFRQLQVETTSRCNGQCCFCPHIKYTPEQIGTMDDALYGKILKDASRYKLSVFYPMLNGEPFCDPDFIKRVHLARQYLPDTVIKIFTNGSLMTGADMDALAKAGGVMVSVSLNGARASTRKTLMGLDDFDIVVQKIDYLNHLGILEAVSTIWHPTVSLKEINEMGKFPHPDAFQFQNWCNEIYPYRRDTPTNCVRVQMITVLWTGDAVLCCFDLFGKVKFGNLKDKTLQEIWDNPLHKLYLQGHESSHGEMMALCKNCTQG